ncbi:KH domain-containing protein [Ditylenchus destructor]|nr:KH domain-containing protein [Ditylenchus destructor]
MSYLDRNMHGLQICVDVPFVDHPYLIGPRGRKCQHIMDRYKTLIHFPDCNRRPNGNKLNNVLITGAMKNVEEVRSQIRDRTPVRLAVRLQSFNDHVNIARQMENAISQRSLPLRMTSSDNYESGMLKTEWRNESILVKFCDEFLSVKNYRLEDPDVFTVAISILPLVNPWNAELSGRLLEHVFNLTGCRVFYPPKEKFADHPPSYFVKGTSASRVLKATKYLLGLTMFQASFSVPHMEISRDMIDEWENKLLVHVSFESADNGNSDRKATLHSFEFCINNVYVVRSILLGFNKSLQTTSYDFMADAKTLIPCTIFSHARLYFPLYQIDSKDSFDWNISGEEFFKHFYGGPSSLNRGEQHNKDLTARLQSLLDLSYMENVFNNNSDSEINDNDDHLNSSQIIRRLSSNNHLDNKSASKGDKHFALFKTSTPVISQSPDSIEIARGSPQKSQPMMRKPLLQPNFHHQKYREFRPNRTFGQKPNAPSQFSRFVSETNSFSASYPVHNSNKKSYEATRYMNALVPSIAANPAAAYHEDDPKLVEHLQRTMPCLEVTKRQLNSIDHEAIAGAVMTSDSVAQISNPHHHPFNFEEYQVSYPAPISIKEFNHQFKQLVREREKLLQSGNLTSRPNPMANGSDALDGQGKRNSASF